MGANKVRSDQYKTLIDCVDIEDTNVFNRLIDSFSLERILFIPSEGEAQTLLSSTQTVPKNLLHAVVPNYQYYPAPNYRSYYKQDKTRGVLKASVEELLNQLEEQVRNDEEVMVNYEAKVREIKEEKKRFDGLIREDDIKVRRIREQIRKINSSITNLRNEEENEAPV